MPVIQEAAQGNQHRLSAVIELIESCQAMGETLDAETAISIFAQAEVELQRQAEQMTKSLPAGVSSPVATPEDIRDLHALIAAARILWDVASCVQMRTNPGRRLRKVLQARDLVLQEVVRPILLSMRTGDRTAALEQATSWQYTLWGPDHLQMMQDVLASTIAGRPPKKEIRTAAEWLQTRFIPTPDLDRQKNSSD